MSLHFFENGAKRVSQNELSYPPQKPAEPATNDEFSDDSLDKWRNHAVESERSKRNNTACCFEYRDILVQYQPVLLAGIRIHASLVLPVDTTAFAAKLFNVLLMASIG